MKSVGILKHAFQDFERKCSQRLVSDLLVTGFPLLDCPESTTTSTEQPPNIPTLCLLDRLTLDLWRSAIPDAILAVRSFVNIRYFSSLLLPVRYCDCCNHVSPTCSDHSRTLRPGNALLACNNVQLRMTKSCSVLLPQVTCLQVSGTSSHPTPWCHTPCC